MADQTNTCNFPLISLFFILILILILTALSSSADSSRILDQLNNPQPSSLIMGLTANANGPGPNSDLSVSLSFFLHDIMGGSHPTARTVTGSGTTAKAKAEAESTAALPFTKPNNKIFPLPGGVPLIISTANRNSNGGNNNNNNNNQPFVTAGQLPSRATLRHLMFGSLTTIDDELTEGEELGSAVMGRAQGFYFVSSWDGSSHTVALTVILHQHHEDDEIKKDDDTISFFGVHRRVSPESPIAVVGGTGKYEKAGGFAVIENLRRGENQQHFTDGADTIVHFKVYLSK